MDTVRRSLATDSELTLVERDRERERVRVSPPPLPKMVYAKKLSLRFYLPTPRFSSMFLRVTSFRGAWEDSEGRPGPQGASRGCLRRPSRRLQGVWVAFWRCEKNRRTGGGLMYLLVYFSIIYQSIYLSIYLSTCSSTEVERQGDSIFSPMVWDCCLKRRVTWLHCFCFLWILVAFTRFCIWR